MLRGNAAQFQSLVVQHDTRKAEELLDEEATAGPCNIWCSYSQHLAECMPCSKLVAKGYSGSVFVSVELDAHHVVAICT